MSIREPFDVVVFFTFTLNIAPPPRNISAGVRGPELYRCRVHRASSRHHSVPFHTLSSTTNCGLNAPLRRCMSLTNFDPLLPYFMYK